MTALLDPRDGDIEDDASSTKQRSLLSLGGSLLAEIGLGKLVVAWLLLIGLPGLALGFLPLVASLWIGKFSTQALLMLTGLGSLITLAALAAAIWFGGRPVMRMMEASFWSLQGIGIQPGYLIGREALRHLAERILKPGSDTVELRRIRSFSSLVSALILSAFAVWIATLAWPYTRWTSSFAEFAAPLQLLGPVVANAVAILAIYFSVAALMWGLADALMDAPTGLQGFATADARARRWRIAHLSDIHVVAGPYGFRIESGRAGPRGNQRLERVWTHLAEIHRSESIDVILISGDLTDAGTSTEWAAFFDTLAPYPQLAERVLALPGNHDLNVVDRANPARLELPTSPLKRLRQLRMLSALNALQGTRVQVFDAETGKPGQTLADYLAPFAADISAFADKGSHRLSHRLADVADLAFPMIVPPGSDDGLGVVVLNSNADTHFSFTNALGMVSLAQSRAIEAMAALYPRAGWIIALHHHVVEYPKPAAALSERVGTALINGSYVVRRLQKLAGRAILMHGHRHIEWIGTAGGLVIVSAPSPVMDAVDTDTTHFFIHNIATSGDGRIALLAPEKIMLPGSPAAAG